MSTKIYTAYKLSHRHKTKFNNYCNKLKKELKLELEIQLYNIFLKKIFKVIDNYYLIKNCDKNFNIKEFNELYSEIDFLLDTDGLVNFKENENVIFEFKKFFDFLGEYLKKPIRKRIIDFDYTFSFNIYQTTKSKDYFIIPDLEREDFFSKYIKKNTQLKDFSYWNNTDKPKKIKSRIWKKREQIWHSVNLNSYQKIEIIEADFISKTFDKFISILNNNEIDNFINENNIFENRLKKIILKKIELNEMDKILEKKQTKILPELFKEFDVNDLNIENKINDFINTKKHLYGDFSKEKMKEVYINSLINKKYGTSFFTKVYFKWRDNYNENKDLYEIKIDNSIEEFKKYFPENITIKDYLLTKIN